MMRTRQRSRTRGVRGSCHVIDELVGLLEVKLLYIHCLALLDRYHEGSVQYGASRSATW